MTSVLIAVDKDQCKAFAERVLSEETQKFDKSLLKVLWDRSALAKNIGADEVTIGINSGIQPFGIGVGGSAEVKWTLKKDLDQYTATEVIARIDRLELLPLRPVDELGKDLMKQTTSKSVPPDELVFPGLPLFIKGTLKLAPQHPLSGAVGAEYRIDAGTDSIKAVISPHLAGSLRYCEDRTVKAMGFAQEDSQPNTAGESGTKLGIMLSTVAVWLTDE